MFLVKKIVPEIRKKLRFKQTSSSLVIKKNKNDPNNKLKISNLTSLFEQIKNNSKKLQTKKNNINLKFKEIENKFNSILLILTDENKLIKYHPQIFNNNDSKSLEKFLKKHNDKNIDIILHTSGGSQSNAHKIAELFLNHKLNNKIIFHIPYYAFSAGTFLSLFGDVINLMPYSLLSPIDCQGEVEDMSGFKKLYPIKFLHYKSIKGYNKFSNNKTINKIKKLGKYSNKTINKLVFKYGHDMSFTYQDLNSFGIKNLNPLVDKKIFELMDLLCGNKSNKKFQKIIKKLEKKRNSKILILENYVDLIFFLNNNKIKNITYNKIEIFYKYPEFYDKMQLLYRYPEVYDILSFVSILKNYEGQVTIYPISRKKILKNWIFLLLLSNKKVCFSENYSIEHALPDITKVTIYKSTNFAIYNNMFNQYLTDIKYHFLNSVEYDHHSKKKINDALESTLPFFSKNIKKLDISNLDYLVDKDIIKISNIIYPNF